MHWPVDVTRHNLTPSFADLFKQLLEGAEFVAIDTEFTGLGEDRRTSYAKDIEERYGLLRKLASEHALFEVGVSIFHPRGSQHSYDVCTFTFHLLKGGDFKVSSNSLTFLAQSGLNFSRLFGWGITYSPAGDWEKEKQQKRAKTGTDWSPNLGLREIFRAIAGSAVPVVFHNGLLDMIFLYYSFFGPLPPTHIGFVKALTNTFPSVYDTKYIADFHVRPKASFLMYLFKLSQAMNNHAHHRARQAEANRRRGCSTAKEPEDDETYSATPPAKRARVEAKHEDQAQPRCLDKGDQKRHLQQCGTTSNDDNDGDSWDCDSAQSGLGSEATASGHKRPRKRPVGVVCTHCDLRHPLSDPEAPPRVSSGTLCQHFANHGFCRKGTQCLDEHDVDFLFEGKFEVKGSPEEKESTSASCGNSESNSKSRRKSGHTTPAEDASLSAESSTVSQVECQRDGGHRTASPSTKDTTVEGHWGEDEANDMAVPLARLATRSCKANQDMRSGVGSFGKRAYRQSHSAGFDAFCTGYVFATQVARRGDGALRPSDTITDWVNRLYLMGKQFPLLLQASSFS
eukprot:Rmarinus@m.27419